MNWKVGDKLKVLDADNIARRGLWDGCIFDVIEVTPTGKPIVNTIGGGERVGFSLAEMKYVQRIPANQDEDEDTSFYTEIGEPSVCCNCSEVAGIREELSDIRAMIARLIARGDVY